MDLPLGRYEPVIYVHISRNYTPRRTTKLKNDKSNQIIMSLSSMALNATVCGQLNSKNSACTVRTLQTNWKVTRRRRRCIRLNILISINMDKSKWEVGKECIYMLLGFCEHKNIKD